MLPTIKLEQIIGPKTVLPDLLPIPYVDGALPFDQARVLIAIALHYNPKTVLELGTYFGATTLHLARALPGATIHTVDLPTEFGLKDHLTDHHLISHRLVGLEYIVRGCTNVVQHFADTLTLDFNLLEAQPTFFFIDASHSYAAVKNDSDKCRALCNGPGIYLWHDAASTHRDVVRFLLEWRVLGRDIRVIENTTLAFWHSHDARY